MTLLAKGAFHSWIQTFLIYRSLRLEALYCAKYIQMTKEVQVDRNNHYKEPMDSIGSCHQWSFASIKTSFSRNVCLLFLFNKISPRSFPNELTRVSDNVEHFKYFRLQKERLQNVN